MAKSYPEYDYDLAEEIIAALRPYRPEAIVDMAKGGPAAEKFREAGRRAGSAAVEAGKAHRDRTAEVMDMVAEKTGVQFPPVVQRYLEIWILCSGLAEKWQIRQSTRAGIVYDIRQCAVRERAGGELPGAGIGDCFCYCTGALEAIAEKLGMDLAVNREDLEEGQGLCRFTVAPLK